MTDKVQFQPLGDARDHYWKVTDMAAAVGVSLVDAWDAGELTSVGHADMIERCRGCTGVATCGRLLEDRPALDEAPSYCVNRDVFAGMK
jgi:hypothetical protein